MPLYQFHCDHCGAFDQRLDFQQAKDDRTCPSCARPARRVFTAPGVRTAAGPIAQASAQDRARFDQARTGEPTVTGPPAGRRLRRRGHQH